MLSRIPSYLLHADDPHSATALASHLYIGSSKSDVGSGKGIHAIWFSRLTHVLQLL